MPRRYDLGRRAEQQAETRRRIVAAALDLYRDRGYAATTTRAIADAADVAPGTVRRHFPSLFDLARTAGEQVLVDLSPPDPSVLAGLRTTSQRMERLAHELVAFFARGEPWWSMLQADVDLARAWDDVRGTYERGFDLLVRTALGSLAEDRVARVVTATSLGPTLHYALRHAGLSAEEALEAQLGLVVPWLRTAAWLERPGSRRDPHPGAARRRR